MSIYLESKADLAAMLSVAAGVLIAASDIQTGNPKVTTADEKTQFSRNTRISVGFLESSTVGTSARVVYYDRLDLAPLAKANLHGAKVSPGSNLAAMIPVIRNYTGAVLTADDLVEHSAVLNDTTGVITFQLEAKSTSLGWYGSGTLTFEGAASIETAFSDDRLPGF